MFFTALMLFITVSGGLVGFYNTLTRSAGENVCLEDKNSFCELNPESEWSASSMRFYNKTCESLLGQKVYDCEIGRWENCAYWCKKIQRFAINNEEKSELPDRAVSLFANLCVYKEDCRKKPECSNIDFERCKGAAESLLK